MLQNIALVLINAGKLIGLCIFTQNDWFLAYVLFVIDYRLPIHFHSGWAIEREITLYFLASLCSQPPPQEISSNLSTV